MRLLEDRHDLSPSSPFPHTTRALFNKNIFPLRPHVAALSPTRENPTSSLSLSLFHSPVLARSIARIAVLQCWGERDSGSPSLEALSVKVFVYRKLYPRCPRREVCPLYARPFTRFPRATPVNCPGYSDLECAVVGDTCARFVDTSERQASTPGIYPIAPFPTGTRKSGALKTHDATRICNKINKEDKDINCLIASLRSAYCINKLKLSCIYRVALSYRYASCTH